MCRLLRRRRVLSPPLEPGNKASSCSVVGPGLFLVVFYLRPEPIDVVISFCLYTQMWLTFAPIPDRTAVYYNVSVNAVDWFSITYFIVSLVIGFFSIYVLDTYGLKVSVRVCVCVCVCGCVWVGGYTCAWEGRGRENCE